MDNQLSDASEEELYHQIGRSLQLSLPSGWKSVTLRFQIIEDDVWERSAVVDMGEKQDRSISLRPSGYGMYHSFIELARRMDEAGHGRWQEAVFSMTPDGKFSIDYVYQDH